jgi:diaminopimelate epimerase
MMKFSKYHALGNDYLVIPPEGFRDGLTPEFIRRICHRNYGVGADGILWGPLPSDFCDFWVRIFNSDGSEAEKSGNGLRIFARYLNDRRLVTGDWFSVETLGGAVRCLVDADQNLIAVQMGPVSFDSAEIPMSGPRREVLNEQLAVDEQIFDFCAATVGNPHCVVLGIEPTPENARRYGPLIECDERFPNRTNVQFMRVLDRNNIQIEIWERGAGYTLASGSSSTAAAAVAHKLGLCETAITVHMPGGQLEIELDAGFQATMSGPVEKICEGKFSLEIIKLYEEVGNETTGNPIP